MVRAGCVFVAGIHPSGTWTSGSFESVRWNACMHRLDLGLYSHPKEFLGEWGVNSKGKIPSTEKVPRGGSNPRRCGQRAQALPTGLFRPPRIFIVSSLHHELSQTCTLKWPEPSRLQISSNTSRTYRVQYIVCHVVRRDSSGIRFDRV